MKKTKLILTRQTIRTLRPTALQQVVGGEITGGCTQTVDPLPDPRLCSSTH